MAFLQSKDGPRERRRLPNGRWGAGSGCHRWATRWVLEVRLAAARARSARGRRPLAARWWRGDRRPWERADVHELQLLSVQIRKKRGWLAAWPRRRRVRR